MLGMKDKLYCRFFPLSLKKNDHLERTYTFLCSLRASSPIWASETSLARTFSSAPRSRVLARLASLAQIGELARRLLFVQKFGVC